ncbi:hypothetical protein N0V82_004517 [Gnomoniopsis sp. IMI 355080]|nr:hypothetical protein N0V82_004517 [Gnomoniopsis sp. IMI 355080]
MDNENPTIIEVANLPTRKRERRTKKGGPHKADDITGFNADLPWDDRDDDEQEGRSNGAETGGEPIDEQEIFDMIATISDPEHPLTLAQLAVVNLADIHIDPPPVPGKGPELDALSTVTVELTPTVNHCSLATIIGLAVRVRLDACLPPNYRLDVRMKDGSHAQDDQVNKQLADKERVAAALENDTLKRTLDTMMATCVEIYESDDEN